MHGQTAPVCAWRGVIDLVADVLTGSPPAVATLLRVLNKNPCGLHLLRSDDGEGNGDSFGGDSLNKTKNKKPKTENLV